MFTTSECQMCMELGAWSGSRSALRTRFTRRSNSLTFQVGAGRRACDAMRCDAVCVSARCPPSPITYPSTLRRLWILILFYLVGVIIVLKKTFISSGRPRPCPRYRTNSPAFKLPWHRWHRLIPLPLRHSKLFHFKAIRISYISHRHRRPRTSALHTSPNNKEIPAFIRFTPCFRLPFVSKNANKLTLIWHISCAAKRERKWTRN